MIPWYRSHAFIALVQTSVLLTLGWIAVALSTNVWDWRTGLAIPLVSNIVVGLRAMWSPSITGPFDFMNKSNPTPTTTTTTTPTAAATPTVPAPDPVKP